jgi:hypothetical protein
MKTAGYSQTPLAKKIGIVHGARVHLIDAPREYRKLLAPLPPSVGFVAAVGPDVDVVHVFVTRRVDLARQLRTLVNAIRPDAAIWVSWPKKASGRSTDVTEDVIRAEALPLGLVDVKVCAVDETWSGLKLVIRKERRTR